MTQVTRATTLPELLTSWLPRQRWFADKDRGKESFALTRTGEFMLQEDTGGVGIEVFLVTATFSDGGTVTYQIPLTYRDVPIGALEHALVGVLDDARRGARWVYDAPYDAAFVTAWLQLIADQGQVVSDEGPRRGRARGVLAPRATALDPGWPSHVLNGEQSNTSVIVGTGVTDTPAIVKIFRLLHAGPNPDVIVQSALADAGCERVPPPVGWVEATWADPEGEEASGHLAVATRFLDGSVDAWRLACRAVEASRPFEAEAHALGIATAQVHATLASTLPTVPGTPATLSTLATELEARVTWAATAAPVLLPFAERARAVVGAVQDIEHPPSLQRVHGDYHLGQVLHVPRRGWVLFDFEGEPLRPLDQRTAPDLALRDVAGMVRSFDYAARHATLGLPAGDSRVRAAAWWASAAREAFLDGYTEATGHDPRADAVLLRALELDKALYEVVYETRNRPDWVEVPLSAVRRLLGETPMPAPPGPELVAPPPPPSPPLPAREPAATVPEAEPIPEPEPTPEPTVAAFTVDDVVWTSGVDEASGEPLDEVDVYTTVSPAIVAVVPAANVPAGTEFTATWTIDGIEVPEATMSVTVDEDMRVAWVAFELARDEGRYFPLGELEVTVTTSTGAI